MREYALKNELLLLNADKMSEQQIEKQIIILRLQEFLDNISSLPHKRAAVYCVEHEKHSRIEIFGSCILGVISIPNKKGKSAIRFGYYIEKDRLFLICDSEYLMPIIKKMQEMKFPDNFSVFDFFCSLINMFLNDDIDFLEDMELKIYEIEDRLLVKIPKNFYQTIIPIRKTLTALHSFYYQIVNLSTTIRSNSNELLTQEECIAFGNLEDRAERLKDYTVTLREYLLQIREMHQSQLHIRETKSMNLLTIISSIFLPLTLIAGWYGMNFKFMPELSWRGGYIYVAILSIVIVIIEIIIFKRKKLL